MKSNFDLSVASTLRLAERWVTLEPSGTHVLIDGGEIVGGPKKLIRSAMPGKEKTHPPPLPKKKKGPKWARRSELDKRMKVGGSKWKGAHTNKQQRLGAFMRAHEVGTHDELAAHARGLGHAHANEMSTKELLDYAKKREAEPGHVDVAGKNAPPQHNVQLPANKKKLNIDTAQAALKKMGYSIQKMATFDPKVGTSYKVKTPNGKVVAMPASKIRDLIYARQHPAARGGHGEHGRGIGTMVARAAAHNVVGLLKPKREKRIKRKGE